MKRIFVLIFTLVLVGCSLNNERTNKSIDDNDNSNQTTMKIATSSDELDYQANISDTNVFKEIDYEEIYSLINNNSSNFTGLLYIGRSTCSYCQKAVEIYRSTAIQNRFIIYYLDTTKAKESDKFEKYEHFNFFVDENGEELTEVPTIYAYKEGKVIDHYTGVADDYDDSSKDVTSEQYLFLYNKLVEMNNEISGLD